MSGSAQKHHHEWGDYFTVANLLAAFAVFAWMLLKDCARILTH